MVALDFCTKITNPTAWRGGRAWRGGVQILKKDEEDVRLIDLCEEKGK